MKLIKKIAAIMFAFMMVFTLSSNVNAETVSGSQAEKTTGTLTITNAKPNQTYNLYKMLDLESFSGENYSYKIAEGWNDFFTNSAYEGYKLFNSENGYVTPKHALQDSDLRTLANKALEFANGKITPITVQTNDQGTFTANNLILGYYLLDSSVGTICSLTSSNPNVEIKEKNDIPTVTKLVKGDNDTWDKTNFANIGDKVYFKTTIDAKSGAQNYVLHDQMAKGLQYNKDVVIKLNDKKLDESNYQVILSSSLTQPGSTSVTDFCTFEIKFMQAFCDNLTDTDKIIITYSATLNGDAKVGITDDNVNSTYLSYGDDKETEKNTTDTYTLQIPVFKYTIKDSSKTGLADAKFKLFDTDKGTNAIKLVQKTGTEYYRKAYGSEEYTEEITTKTNGEFSIQGLKPGAYWLEETAAPKGYNKLAKRIKIEIDKYGNLTIDGKKLDDVTGNPFKKVEVENKSGSLLPSTGGMGTTLIYLIGGALVLGSGIVLMNKKRAKAK